MLIFRGDHKLLTFAVRSHMEFFFYLPTRIYFASHALEAHGDELKAMGSKALIVTGRSSAEKNGSLADVISSLDKLGIPYEHFNEVEANPSVETVYKGVELAKLKGADFIIGIGGGSPLDAAKAMALVAANDLTYEELFSGNYAKSPLPYVAVPTTAGTGSEATPYAILTDNRIGNKRNLAYPSMFPDMAFLDPRYTAYLPYETTVNTALDALSHSLEGYLSSRVSRIVEPIALESISILGKALKKLRTSDEISEKVRHKLLYGSLLGGMVISHTGTTCVHAMGYPLTYHKGIDHGRANALLMPAYLDFLEKYNHRVADVLDSLGMKKIAEFDELISDLLGTKESIGVEEIDLFVSIAKSAGNISNTDPAPTEKDIKAIYMSALL